MSSEVSHPTEANAPTVKHAGAVNAHTHLYSGLAPLGLPAPDPPPANFLEILEKVWWRLDRALDETSLKASARCYLAEALLSGTTAVIDHHESPNLIEGSLDILADAAHDLGIRLAVCYGATERNFGLDEAERGLRECRRFAASNRRPLVRAMVGIHASFTVSDVTLRGAGALARELSLPVHVHVAEDRADIEDAKKRGFAGPLERLFACEALPRGSILAHGVYLSPAQVKQVDDAGLWLVHNPRSNRGNRLDYAGALGHSAHVALGTDGWASDMGVELSALIELAQKNSDRADVSVGGAQALAVRRWEGSLRLGEALFGSRESPGDERSVSMDVVVAPADWPRAGRPRDVVVAGRAVVRDGQLLTADIEEIRAHAREEAQKLWRRMERISA